MFSITAVSIALGIDIYWSEQPIHVRGRENVSVWTRLDIYLFHFCLSAKLKQHLKIEVENIQYIYFINGKSDNKHIVCMFSYTTTVIIVVSLLLFVNYFILFYYFTFYCILLYYYYYYYYYLNSAFYSRIILTCSLSKGHNINSDN